MECDTCQTQWPPCWLPNQQIANETYPFDWSDGGAGGQFGVYVGGVFTPVEHPAGMATHYKCPDTPQVVILKVTLNDEVWTEDPVTHQFITAADDSMWTTADADARRFTVWDLTITDGAAGWAPLLDDKKSFTATIAPANDHLGNSMARVITFTATASAEPGYCLNTTREVGQPNDTSGSDLKLLAPQPDGITLGGAPWTSAHTTAAALTATVDVTCLDYGAYGWITASAALPPGGGQAMARCTATPVGPGARYNAPMPWDGNDNHIADSAHAYDKENGQAGGPPAAATRDVDGDPVGDQTQPNGTTGDYLTNYEEYRGLRIASENAAAGARVQLDVTKKDVFVLNRHLLDQADLTSANLGASVHYMAEGEVSGTWPGINGNTSEEHRVGLQFAILVTNEPPSGGGFFWGYTTWTANPAAPAKQTGCRVHVARIQGGDAPTLTVDITAGATEIQVSPDLIIQQRYQAPGKIKIENEVVLYTGAAAGPTRFTGCTRGADGTTAAAHAAGTRVSWFLDPASAIRMVFAHEAMHLTNLGHRPVNWQIIQVENLPAGSTNGAGIWHVFRNANFDALSERFRARP